MLSLCIAEGQCQGFVPARRALCLLSYTSSPATKAFLMFYRLLLRLFALILSTLAQAYSYSPQCGAIRSLRKPSPHQHSIHLFIHCLGTEVEVVDQGDQGHAYPDSFTCVPVTAQSLVFSKCLISACWGNKQIRVQRMLKEWLAEYMWGAAPDPAPLSKVSY